MAVKKAKPKKPTKYELAVKEWKAQEARELFERIWCTSYCNKGHRLGDGKPVGHECYVLPPAALEAEYMGEVEEAIAILEAAKPLREHAGLKDRSES